MHSIIDLHTHSKASDGDYSPAALMQLARENHVSLLALTDHDTVAGDEKAREAAREEGIIFIPGIELSANWGQTCIHVVGLNVDTENPPLKDACVRAEHLRAERAEKIDARFKSLGIDHLLKDVKDIFPDVVNVSRAHFARALIRRAVVKNEQEAFDRFLGAQGPAYVPTGWPELSDAIALISQAGGVPVLAHPLRYRFASDLAGDALVEAFVTAGGQAIEVISGSQIPQCSSRCAVWARKYGLFASTGSDFHRLSTVRPMLGHQPELPADLNCVTELLDLPKPQ